MRGYNLPGDTGPNDPDAPWNQLGGLEEAEGDGKMLALSLQKSNEVQSLFGCALCADNKSCNLEPRTSTMAGCQKWRCHICRGPWWCTSMDHDKCMAAGVPNGIFYHDGSSMKPLSDASGHYMSHDDGYCEIHKSWRCGIKGA